MSARGFDIAIIGGGVIGLTLARALGRDKTRVVVIDAAAEIPPATNAAAGMLAPSFEKDAGAAAEALYALSARSLALWPDFAAALEDETGLSVDYRGDGMLGLAFHEDEAGELRRRCDRLTARGAAVERISGDEARRLEPALAETVCAALLAHDDAQVDARKTLTALRAGVEKRIGPITAGRAVRAAQRNSGFSVSLADGNRLEAAALVLAGGAAAMTGLVEGLPPPPVVPVKGEALALAMPEPLIGRVVRAPGAYLCPKAGGRLIIGATEVPGRNDYDVDAAAIAALKKAAGEAVPATAGLGELERWAGLRPGAPDAAPMLGRDPRGPENVFLALGHYRNGVLLAPAVAEALEPAISGGAPVTDLQPFSPARFAAGGRHG